MYAGDLVVLGVCSIMLILLFFSFKVRSRAFRMFLSLVGILMAAAATHVTFHTLLKYRPNLPTGLFYGFQSLYHGLLLFMLYQFAAYICQVTGLTKEERKVYHTIGGMLILVVLAAELFVNFSGSGIQLGDGAVSAGGNRIFMIGYGLFIVMLSMLMIQVRHHLYRRMMNGFYVTMAFAVAMLAIAKLNGQDSFTTATFLFPVVAIMYLLHSNPYDAQLGSNDLRGLEGLIRYSDDKGKTYLYLSLYMRELDETARQIPGDLQAIVRRFTAQYFRSSVMFRVGNGHLLMMVRKERNPDYEARTEAILRAFDQEYQNFKLDYKIVIGQTTAELNRNNEYVSFIRSIHTRIPENTIYRVQPDDIDKFRKYEAILHQLADIAGQKNLDDPRVLVYCQPVLNIRTGKYDTAEALMRLHLSEEGLVYPDRFIALAEENGFIHMLTEIILHKVCKAVKALNEEGYCIDRVSVNVSAMELRDQHFCMDISSIIDRSGIDGKQIAIEMTESRNERDFLLMKEKIAELKQKGITFYLDDFGTGYSNMERILELPFDIIKFDRSMVVAGAQDKRSEQVLGSLADLFAKLDYAVLFEGVETEQDEEMCRECCASYLHGYKYSRPVPMEQLKEFLTKK